MGVSDHGRLGDHSRRPQRMGGTVSIVVQEYCGSIAILLREASRGWWKSLRGSASTSSVSSLGTRSGSPGLAAGEGGSCWPGIPIEEWAHRRRGESLRWGAQRKVCRPPRLGATGRRRRRRDRLTSGGALGAIVWLAVWRSRSPPALPNTLGEPVASLALAHGLGRVGRLGQGAAQHPRDLARWVDHHAPDALAHIRGEGQALRSLLLAALARNARLQPATQVGRRLSGIPVVTRAHV